MRQTLLKVNYLIAISLATLGWLYFIGWIIMQLI